MDNFSNKSDVNVFVLTLKGSVDRQLRIKQALDKADIDFEFFLGCRWS
ncbi:MAG: hypothetical protein MH186_10510 [Marinobacter sp.]|nr:hypothetical protein [Marinobacter sp.]